MAAAARRRLSDDYGGYRRLDIKPAHQIDGQRAWPPPNIVVWRTGAISLGNTPWRYLLPSTGSTPSQWSETVAVAGALGC